MKTGISILLLIILCGCSNLPNGKMSEFHSNTSVMGVQSKVDATGMSATDATVKAESFVWAISWPLGSRTTEIKGFEQKRKK